MLNQRCLSARRLATYLLLWNSFGTEIAARPNPQESEEPSNSGTKTVAPVTLVATVDGQPIAATYTPTSIAISGLVPPITAATTVTTTDEAGATIAVAIAAGAGVVAGGALAVWLFEPVAGAPPAPTTPPSYPTETQDNEPPPSTVVSDEPEPTTTTSDPPSCPFPTEGSGRRFEPAADQPEWTAEIPIQTGTTNYPKCKSTGDNNQLLRGTYPEFIEELSDVFCKNEQSRDVSKTIGKEDLPDDSSWKRDSGPKEQVKFTFDFKSKAEGCSSHCKKAFKRLISRCQYSSHVLHGGGSLKQGCGDYALEIKGDPITKLKCNGGGANPLAKYMYRDAALDAVKNFCQAQDGKTVKQGKESSFIKETSFTVRYAEQCGGSGSYTLKKDLCMKYLSRAVDECDTDTIAYKHGGGLQDMDNCGLFEFHPKGFDAVMCYPENVERQYLSHSETVTRDVARDAINAYCDRSGDGQQYTLDPDVRPGTGGFIQDGCNTEGLATCNYYYRNDGTRADEGELGDFVVGLSARHENPNNQLICSPSAIYEIHGERCKKMLGKLIGDGTVGKCDSDSSNKFGLGTIIESGEKGCVLWNMWATKTHS